MSTFEDLAIVLSEKFQQSVKNHKAAIEDDRVPLYTIFSKSITQTLEDIKLGADSDDFGDLVVINFIIRAHKNRYTSHEIRTFVAKLKSDDVIVIEDIDL